MRDLATGSARNRSVRPARAGMRTTRTAQVAVRLLGVMTIEDIESVLDIIYHVL